MHDHVLTLDCPDAIGIVHTVTGLLAERRCNITDSAQYGDPETGHFFMRVSFAGATAEADKAGLNEALTALASKNGMTWTLHDARRKQRVLILVSRIGHCLNDLLYRFRAGILPMEIPAIVSNHRDFYQLAAWHNVPFHYWPVTAATKERAESQLLQLVEEEKVDLVVLARYMQILSAELCDELHGRAINIHHSFLPGFKGARPYHQAHERGVKLIGATAHYVTADLDEGPIIEQDVIRVNHTHDAEALARLGRDVERSVLYRAVQAHAQDRVILIGDRTIVFS
jgi:formyltetrahydrofolate deformylase